MYRILVFSLFIFMSCTQKDRVVMVQPFENFNDELANELIIGIKKIKKDVVLLPQKKLNKSTFYAPRNRFRADSILKFYGPTFRDDTIFVGITHKDISTTLKGNEDWGIMGLAKCPGNVCITSSFRVDNAKIKSQLFKVMIHEMGHTEGLSHCKNDGCIMMDANGKNKLESKTDFCVSCKKHLEKRGWNLQGDYLL